MFRRIALFAMIGGMMAHAQEPVPVGKSVNFYSKEKEAALGAMVAKEVRQTETMLDSDTVREYVRALGRRIAAQVPGEPVNTSFDVIVDRSPAPLHEPVTLPGGHVFVRSGLFLAAQDETEFTGMLAHAIVHAAERHGTRSATRGQVANIASIPLIYMGGWVTPNASLMVPVGFLKFARQHELEADRLAIQLMASAGFNPAGLIGYIGRTQVDPERKQFSALPPLEERLAALNTAAFALPARPYESSEEFAVIRDEVRKVIADQRPQREPPSLRRKTPQQP